VSRYFFLALAIVGLLGTATGVFAQSQQPQLTVTPSNVKGGVIVLHQVDLVAVSGEVVVSGSWSGAPLNFGGWVYVTGQDCFG